MKNKRKITRGLNAVLIAAGIESFFCICNYARATPITYTNTTWEVRANVSILEPHKVPLVKSTNSPRDIDVERDLIGGGGGGWAYVSAEERNLSVVAQALSGRVQVVSKAEAFFTGTVFNTSFDTLTIDLTGTVGQHLGLGFTENTFDIWDLTNGGRPLFSFFEHNFKETIYIPLGVQLLITAGTMVDVRSYPELPLFIHGSSLITWDLRTSLSDNPGTEPIPEPTTIALLGIGLVGLAGAEVRRRRKKKAINS